MSEADKLERGISVVLCTYNGVISLRQTVRHLAGQQIQNDLPWEIVFVDNASTDGSATLVQQEWAELGNPGKLVCLRESKPGKYFALQTALANVRYAYFVICDDDNWLAPDYLINVTRLLDSHPEVGAVGGRGIPVIEKGESLPKWFDDYQEGYAVGPQGKHPGDVTYKGHLWGAGLGSRTTLYRAIYSKYPSFLLQLNDPSVMSTEDSEYCLRLVLRGYRLYYDDSLVYHHLIPLEKLTESFIENLYKKHYTSYAVNGKYFLAMKAFKDGRLKKSRLWKIWFSGFIGGLFARSHKRKVRARTKREFFRLNGSQPDRVGQGIVNLIQDEQLPRNTRLAGY